MKRCWWLGAMVWSACASSSMPAAPGPDGAAPGADVAAAPATDVAGPAPDTAVVPPPDAAAAGCTLDRPYEFYRDGGLRLYADNSKLLPPRQHRITRDRHRGAPLEMCSHTLRCETIDALASAIAHPDVVAALKLAARPHYGGDPRPVDGTIFVFVRDDGRGFSVGPGNVPPGVRALEELLLKVEEESLGSPECAVLK